VIATEGSLSIASLTFTPANWNIAQTVVVTGVDDALVDGNQAYSVILGMALSSDANFAGQTPSPVSVVNQDNDAAGFTLTPTSPLVTTESGGTATFNVVLNTQPLASVTIPLLSSNPLEGALGQTFLTFTAANWNIAQSVIVTGGR